MKCERCGYITSEEDLYENHITKGTGTKPEPEQDERIDTIEINSDMAGAFVAALGWYNAHLNYHEDVDKFYPISATTYPEEERKFNELYRMYKSGYTSRNAEVEALKAEIESMRSCENCAIEKGHSSKECRSCERWRASNKKDNWRRKTK